MKGLFKNKKSSVSHVKFNLVLSFCFCCRKVIRRHKASHKALQFYAELECLPFIKAVSMFVYKYFNCAFS